MVRDPRLLYSELPNKGVCMFIYFAFILYFLPPCTNLIRACTYIHFGIDYHPACLLNLFWGQQISSGTRCFCFFLSKIKRLYMYVFPLFITTACINILGEENPPCINFWTCTFINFPTMCHPTLKFRPALNSLRQSDAYMHQKPKPSLVQIMACRLFGPNPLSEPIPEYWTLGNTPQ